MVTEIIANAWDADATKVIVTLDIDNDRIAVEDDGHGMCRTDVQQKFLAVGYSRRTSPTGDMSKSGRRRVMGRKGIGKLAMFSLARNITIVTKDSASEAVAFSIDVDDLLSKAQASDTVEDYPIQQIDVPADFTQAHGTRIVLSQLNTKINKTETYLRPRLARRFGVFSDTFKVELGNHPISRSDAGYYGDIQFLWCFDQATSDAVQPLTTSIASAKNATGVTEKCVALLPAVLAGDIPNLTLSGFIASVDKPAKLGKGDDSLNKLAVFANGRLFQEDILPDLGDARYFNSYLVGEIHADFLDQDGIDRATASRESIRHDDERFLALRTHLRTVFNTIRDQWDDWRIAQGYDGTPDKNPEIVQWISGFKDARDRKAADKLMTSIGKLVLHNDEAKDVESKKLLYKSAVVGFEKLRVRQQLDKLEAITDVMSPEFHEVFATLDEIEANSYLEIVRQRLEIIEKFETEIVDAKKLEKVAQEYLFGHLWLLDPMWDRVTGSEQMELTLTTELKRACPDVEQGARLDIAYRTTAGRHVVIELKRPGLFVAGSKLEMQGRKYVEALKQWYREHPDVGGLNGRDPAIDVYFLVDRVPELTPNELKAWEAYYLKALSYEGLIVNAKRAYEAYFAVNKEIEGRLSSLLSSL